MTMSTQPTSEARADTTCRHGWRGTVPENGERIVTPCPSCGRRTLFIGTGGHLTCGNLGPDCKEPGVERQIELMKSQLAAPPHPAAPADAGDVVTAMEKEFGNLINEAYACDSVRSGDRIREKIGAWAFDHQAEIADALAAARRLLDAPPGVGERTVHRSKHLFVALCGSDTHCQATTEVDEHVTCLSCLKLMLSPDAKCAELRKALQPFATFADQWHESWADDTRMDREFPREKLVLPTIGDCRRARAALAASAEAGSVATGEGGR
jgi:hypothetical protein